MSLVKKIVAGGQTGVDQGALRLAIDLKIDCGGWCPPGRVCEDGIIPLYFPLTETAYERSDEAPGIPRSLRTEWNVRDSDATLILLPGNIKDDEGTNWTLYCIRKYQKDYLTTDPFDKHTPWRIAEWLQGKSNIILNVAGPSEKTKPGVGAQVYTTLLDVFKSRDE